MALMASGVALPPDLSSVFSGIGTGAYNKIGANYGGAMAKPTFDPSLGGSSGITDYQRQRLNAGQGLDIGNLEAGLGGAEGNAAYQNQLGARNYGQQRQLTDIIGNATAPSTLQEIFSGIGSGARAGGQMLPFLQMMNRGGNGNVSIPSGGGSSWNIMQPGSLDLGYGGF